MADAPADDPSISNETLLLRRIHPSQWIPAEDAPGGYRATSEIFSDPELSVVIASECSIELLLHGHGEFGVAQFAAGDIRECGWGVVRVPDDKLPGHCHVTGKNKKQKLRSRLAKKCTILRVPRTHLE
jgi:hypothetical protein